MPVTIADIARSAGVGPTTVIRALKDQDRINPETKARIRRIAAEMKYRPNDIARSLATGKSSFVGILTTPSVIPVFASIFSPIEKILRNSGYPILFYTSSGHPEDERVCLEQPIQHRVAGVIVHPSSTPAGSEVYQELVDSGIKVVIIDRYIEGVRAPQIVGDDYQSARLATEFLISLGHRNIVHLAIPQTSYAGTQRASGFRDAMAGAGLTVTSSSVIDVGLSAEEGYEAMSGLLKRKNRPTAILARQDVVAIGAMRAIYSRGLRIPEEVSIVGNGDFWCDDMLKSALTTIHHPIEEMAKIAAHKLLAMLAGERVEPVTEVLSVKLIIRESTAPPK